MGWESFGVVEFDQTFQGQMKIVKPKNAYNSLFLGPRGL